MKNKFVFAMDWQEGIKKSKDLKLIGKLFTLKAMGVDQDGNNTGENLKARLIDINREGYYVFKVTTPKSELDEFSTRVPNDGDVEK